MHVHRSVGQVTFVTCDLVLGAPQTPHKFEQLLDRLEPQTIAVDLSIDDLNALDDDTVDDPFLDAHLAAVESDADHSVLEPYQRLVAWSHEHDAELKPLGSRSSVGIVKARRIKRTLADVDVETFESRARAGVENLLNDAQVGPLATRRKDNLAESLTRLLGTEPPRTLAVFAFPWGEMVSAEVRTQMGLRRMEGEQLAGGWPE